MNPRHARSRFPVSVPLLFALLGLATPVLAAETRIGPGLARAIAADPTRRVVAWVTFTDRAGSERDAAALDRARARLTPRALERRLRRGSLPGVVPSDLPVHEPYVRALVGLGADLRGTSRWLNAASVEMPASLVPALARLPFVARVELVPTGRPLRPVPEPGTGAILTPVTVAPAEAAPTRAAAVAAAPGQQAYYGGSFRQLDMMQVPALHAQGWSGSGVLVCILDGGFHTTHRAFSGLNIVATRDFVFGDTNVDDQAGQDAPGNASHGSMTLGCVAGSVPGTYSGGAFHASVALGKTEAGATETPVEMDYWQFGAEWADSLGADVISSSLGYSEFDNSLDSYTYADMDGRTTVVTLAAVEAARRGITVVDAAGNEGTIAWHYVVAPADADSIVTVGAVDSLNVLAAFSSRGPTADGRTKPDVVAMGRSVLLVNPNNDSTYVRANGTSFATPLAAGVAALILEAHPSWGPFEVREALRGSALNHAVPNDDIGWGLVQGAAAAAWTPSTAAAPPAAPVSGLRLAAGPSPLRAGAPGAVRFAAPGPGRVRIELVDLAGRRLATLYEGPAAAERAVAWTGRDAGGSPLTAGVYWVRMSVSGAGGDARRAVRVVVLP